MFRKYSMQIHKSCPIFYKFKSEYKFPSKMENKDKDKALSINDFMLLSVIGKGSYAKVILVKKKDTEEILALKVLKKEMVEKRKQQQHVIIERDVLV
jgi:serine/threonine protein kinase